MTYFKKDLEKTIEAYRNFEAEFERAFRSCGNEPLPPRDMTVFVHPKTGETYVMSRKDDGDMALEVINEREYLE